MVENHDGSSSQTIAGERVEHERSENEAADRKIALELDDRARNWLAEAGFDAVYGARPLKRVIQRTLQNPLASKTAPTPRAKRSGRSMKV